MFKNMNCSVWVNDCNYSISENMETITAWKIENGEKIQQTETLADLLCGFPFNMNRSDAEFLAEYYPELIYSAGEHWKYYPYSWMQFSIMSEKDLAEFLEYMNLTEEDLCENYGTTIRDAELSGVFVLCE